MDLETIMAENPAIAAQVREMQRTEYERGKADATEAAEKRVKAVVPYLDSQSYGAEVQKLAAEVLAGESDPIELKSYVRFLDARKATEQVDAAKAETDEAGDVPADTSAVDPVEAIKAQLAKGGR